MSDTILLVEDDQKLGTEIRDALAAEGYEVEWVKDGSTAEWLDPNAYGLVVLDLMLPGRHGFDVLKRFREVSDVPVLILTARTETADKVRGFELGGDDYMTKPFWPEELVARVAARLRRPVLKRGEGIEVGRITVETDTRVARVDDEELELTRVEFDLLATLAGRPGMAFSRRQLVDRVLDEEREGTERTLDVHVSRLRKKLGEAAEQLETVWGIGYKLVESPGE
jgi:two-component system response regulator MtrA